MTNNVTPKSTLDNRPPRRTIGRASWQAWLLLVIIVLVGAYFRTIGLYTWDDPSFRLHPDERFFTDVASLTHIPASFGSYIDSSENTLNPRNRGKEFYVYGLLPQTITRFSAVMLTPNDKLPPTVPITVSASIQVPNNELSIPKLTLLMPLLNPEEHNLTDYYDIYRVGRTWSLIWDCCSIVLVFLIGRRLYRRRVGLLAALFYALSVLPIQLAHFFTVDATTGFFTLLTIYLAVRLAQNGRWGTAVALGLSIGATMACRITLATLALVAVAALIVRLLPERASDEQPDSRTHVLARASLRPRTAAAMLVLIGVLSFFTFRTLQPDAFVGSRADTPESPSSFMPLAPLFHGKGFFDIRPEPRFIENIQNIGQQISGEVDAPPSQQWAGRTPYLFSLQNMVLWGLGLPLGIVAWLGWLVAGWQLIRRRMLIHLVPWLWIAFYFAWQGGQFVMTMRYYALLYGLLAIFAAWLLVGRHKVPEQRQKRSTRAFLPSTVYLLPFVVVVATGLWAYAFTRIYTQPHSRITASRWIYDHIPPGATLTTEEWDDGLPLNLDGRSSNQYHGIQTQPYYEDDPNKYSGNLTPDGLPGGLLDQLDQADYLTFSSNRVYDSATRMPARYPALTRYYHYLFTGELGFKLVADIHSYPTLFGVEIPTPIYAEEAFSVYDHPRVLIFEKTPQYSRGLAERLITDDIAWGDVYKVPTVKASRVPSALRLTDVQWPAFRAAGTWSALFSTSFITESLPWLPWLLVLELIGLATFALLFRLLPDLPDRGYSLAKTLGVLLVAYAAWLLGSWGWAAFAPATLWLCAAPLLVAGALMAWHSRDALRSFGQQRRAALVTAEALFLVAFFGFVIVRALNPDLWHPARGGEKPMDLAFMTAVLKSAAFPPYDPWFAGGYINYYYFGFVFVGALVHLSSVPPTIAYNLAVPTIFALSALGAFGVVYNLLAGARQKAEGKRQKAKEQKSEFLNDTLPFNAEQPTTNVQPLIAKRSIFPFSFFLFPSQERHAIVTGLLAAMFVVLLGNLAQAIWFLPGTANHNDAGMPAQCQQLSSYATQNACRGRDEWAFWDATRIVSAEIAERTGAYDGTITEFPFFTFLYGDLHAHMIALPLALLALGLMVAIIKARNHQAKTAWWRFSGAWFLTVGALALVIGALRATNTWDYPTYLGLSILTLGMVEWAAWRRGAVGNIALMRWLLAAAVLVLLSSVLFRPFTQHFATDYAGAELWHGARTGIVESLKINGVWLFLIISAMLVRFRDLFRTRAMMVAVCAMIVLFVGVLIVLDTTALVLLIPLFVVGVSYVVYLLSHNEMRTLPRVSLPTLLLSVWGFAAVGLSLMVEMITSKGDAGRMNTVFKFGMQSWTLFALVAAVALTWVWGKVRSQENRAESVVGRQSSVVGWVWRGAALLLIAGALVYPVTATPARLKDRFDTSIGPTLDGAAYMHSAKAEWGENNQTFTLAQDADALSWMRQNIIGTPIILEAQTDAYHWAGRVATYTGLPALLGWPGHEAQQRKVTQVDPVLQSRGELIRTLYSTTDANQALHSLQLYGVEYVYVGQLERALYDAAGLAKFDALAKAGQIKAVYSQGETRIYEVPRGTATPAELTTTLAVQTPHLAPEKTLMLSQPVETLPVVNEYAWNRLADSQPVAVVLWLLAWYGLLALGLPIAALVFGRWRDGGWAWSRLIGLLLLGYAVWLPVSARLWAYNLRGVLLGVVLVLALNAGVVAWIGRRTPTSDDPIIDGEDEHLADTSNRSLLVWASLAALWAHLRAHRRRILLTEALFLVGFGAMLVVRVLNPDLWQPSWGGEKPFEFAFLNAILRSPVMPPYNPFYSDGVINYYYYGLFLVSLPIKIIGVAPAIGFNLAIPTLFALMLSGAFTLADKLTGRVRYGLVGMAFVTIVGNIATVFPVGSSQGIAPVRAALEQGVSGFGERLGDWFVGPSRVIPFTINEFPFWSYLFADLHPHLIAMPITLLAIALALCLFEHRRSAIEHADSSVELVVGGRWSVVAVAALTLGALAVTNSWDVPTYALLIGGALLGAVWRGRRTWRAFVLALVQAGAVVGGALLLYLPFFQNFQAQVRGVSLVQNGTSLRDYVLIYGLFLLVLVPAVLGAAWELMRRYVAEPLVISSRTVGFVAMSRPAQSLRSTLPWLGIGALVLLVLASWMVPVVALKLWLGALIVVGVLLLRERRMAAPTWFALWMAVVAWAVSLGVEFVYIRDHLADGDWSRMNTVFKFGLQSWILMALAAVALLPLLMRNFSRLRMAVESIGWVVLTTFSLIALVSSFEQGWGRSTVFDSEPSWEILLVLAATTLFPLLLRSVQWLHTVAENVGWIALTLLGAMALVFPIVGTPSRVAYRFPQTPAPTLDGLAFMQQGEYDWNDHHISLHDDGDAIQWLNENIKGTPIVLQSSLEFYRAYGVRVAANTGFPTVVSPLHESEQRPPELVAQRDDDVNTLYRTTDIAEALRILSKYRVGYVYVGQIERAAYGDAGIVKFEQMEGQYLSQAYHNPSVTIYKVNDNVTSFAVAPPIAGSLSSNPPVVIAQPNPAPAQPVPSADQPALEALEAQAAANPTSASAAFGLAQAYRALNRLDDAAAVLAKAAAANTQDVALHQLLGDIQRDAGHLDEAENAYQQAAEAMPTAGNYNKLGTELLKMKRTAKALAAFQLAVSAGNDDPSPYFYLGQMYEQQGEHDLAVQNYTRYVTVAPDGPYRAEATKALQRLK